MTETPKRPQVAEYGPAEHKAMVESRVRRIDYFQAECPCGWRDKFPSLTGAELHLIDHYRSKHRWSEGQTLKCGKGLGSRPSWMSPDQYDPCPCLLDLGHEGDCACSHVNVDRLHTDREGHK